MAESFESPDDTERLQINLEDDVRSFLLGRLAGNRISDEQRAELVEMGVDLKRLSRPSYLSIKSGCDMPEEEDAPVEGCHVGAEGYMIQEDEAYIHLAFKCGDAAHEMHYTRFMPLSIIEMAKAMETVWPGSIMGPMMNLMVKLGRAKASALPPSFTVDGSLDDEGAQRIMKAIERLEQEGPDFDFDEEDEDLEDVDIDEDLDDEEDDEDDLVL